MATNERFDEAVSKWLEESAPAGLPERVLNATFERTRKTRQHAGWRAFLGRPEMLRFAAALGSAAVLVVVAAVAVNFFVNQPGFGGPPPPSPSPSPSPVLLARGNFVPARDWGTVELEATRAGSDVSGSMTMTRGEGGFTADLQCSLATEDGFLIIGGYVTPESGSHLWPTDTLVALVLKRGAPVQGQIWIQNTLPLSRADNCADFLDEQMRSHRRFADEDFWLDPIEGTVEFGPRQ
jgi:hypothetical protein